MVKKIALLGATGSIGGSCFKVVAEQRIIFLLASPLPIAITPSSALSRLIWHPTLVFTGIDDTSLQASIRREFPTLRIYFGKDSLLSLLLNEITKSL
jgi:1-deoxy-D-xylulose 5-phosphate reductoisomerase